MKRFNWTQEQKEELSRIADACKELQSLAPLYAAIWISNEPLTQDEIRRGQELATTMEKDEPT